MARTFSSSDVYCLGEEAFYWKFVNVSGDLLSMVDFGMTGVSASDNDGVSLKESCLKIAGTDFKGRVYLKCFCIFTFGIDVIVAGVAVFFVHYFLII